MVYVNDKTQNVAMCLCVVIVLAGIGVGIWALITFTPAPSNNEAEKPSPTPTALTGNEKADHAENENFLGRMTSSDSTSTNVLKDYFSIPQSADEMEKDVMQMALFGNGNSYTKVYRYGMQNETVRASTVSKKYYRFDVYGDGGKVVSCDADFSGLSGQVMGVALVVDQYYGKRVDVGPLGQSIRVQTECPEGSGSKSNETLASCKRDTVKDNGYRWYIKSCHAYAVDNGWEEGLMVKDDVQMFSLDWLSDAPHSLVHSWVVLLVVASLSMIVLAV